MDSELNLEQEPSHPHRSLNQWEGDLADFVENAMVGLHWVDGDGTIIWVNQAELDLFGYTREEYIGHHIAEFHVDQDVIADILKRLAADERLSNCEARIRCRDGSIKHVLVNSSARFEDGQFIHSRCFTVDISERKKAQERITSLYQLASSFSKALTADQVAQLIVEQGIEKAGASAGAVVLAHKNRPVLEVIAYSGYESNLIRTWQRFSVDSPVALAECIRSQQPIWLQDFEELQARFPTMIPNYEDRTYAAWAAVPLIVENHIIGALGLSFATPQSFEESDRYFIVVLAQQCALALERTRLSEEAQDLAILEERQRIARDLHDSVTQTLFSATTMAEASLHLVERQPQKLPTLLTQVHQLIKGAGAELQFLLYELQPEMFDRSSLVELVSRLVDATRARKQLSLSFQSNGNQPLPHEVRVTFFHIAQEIFTSIIKYSDASTVDIYLQCVSAGAELRVRYDGQGFATSQANLSRLAGMKERASAIGATFEAENVAEQGNEVVLLWQVRH